MRTLLILLAFSWPLFYGCGGLEPTTPKTPAAPKTAESFFRASNTPVPKLALTSGFPFAFYSINANCESFLASFITSNGGIGSGSLYGPNYGAQGLGNGCSSQAIQAGMKLIWQISAKGANGSTPVSYVASSLNLPLSQADVESQVMTKVNAVLNDANLSKAVSYWYVYSEELRYWNKGSITSPEGDMAYLTTVRDAIRAAEAVAKVANRPILSYQPNNRTASDLKNYIAYYDAIVRGSYTSGIYNDSKRISNVMAGANAVYGGSNMAQAYLPVVGLNMDIDPVEPAPSDAQLRAVIRNNIYLAIARGAKGIFIWSYALRPGFSANWRDKIAADYLSISTEMNATEPLLGQAFAYGEMARSDAVVSTTTNGSASDWVLQDFYYKNTHYLLAVSASDTNTIHANLSGWPSGSQITELLTQPSSNASKVDQISFDLAPQQVRIWQLSTAQV